MSTTLTVAAYVTYAVGWLACAVVVARHMLRDTYAGPPDAEETVLLGTLALLAGVVWPLALPIALVVYLARRESPGERRERRAVERDAVVRERDRRIAALERELGIGDQPPPTGRVLW